jgi:RNA polymerase sigma-70 factor, ECF subfamily
MAGMENVFGMLAALMHRFALVGVECEPHEVNGQPGALFRDRDGRVLSTLALDIAEGRIQAIRAVVNPDKLGHLGPVGDAWAVNREAGRKLAEQG